ncbi:A/G-specific adenine glycosylase [Rhizocola hellebori]|uniref:Adenine DNA glycosylase n=1 Tax=Rhizocola hellebori TaxID=1392758 RepID=A0A8J3VJ84_9ACTN|nr:A/G-specific adenine glycosylase [Rhizocola hellebori]GIH08380.1 A/G-specific adenine glycosylase [Rhizocola hellebori]
MPSFLAEQTSIWYQKNARDLPWRHEGVGAWAILISEVMLQQTPVSRVLTVWQEWIERWPSPADLAAEPAGEAIRAWGRLGYPRRAMRLHECAGEIVRRHGGEVPDELDKLLALPGIGDYTARAVLSFAFGQRHPVVDTNVRRVVSRVHHGVEDRAIGLAEVAELLPLGQSDAALASAALMELGAVVCAARSPRCGVCPVMAECRWKQLGSPQPEKPFRRPQSYAGTDRQVRGLLLAVLRESAAPVPRHRLDLVWPDGVQRERALQSLLADGLVQAQSCDVFLLPDSTPAQ